MNVDKELKNPWNMKVTMITIVVGAHGKDSKGFAKTM